MRQTLLLLLLPLPLPLPLPLVAADGIVADAQGAGHCQERAGGMPGRGAAARAGHHAAGVCVWVGDRVAVVGRGLAGQRSAASRLPLAAGEAGPDCHFVHPCVTFITCHLLQAVGYSISVAAFLWYQWVKMQGLGEDTQGAAAAGAAAGGGAGGRAVVGRGVAPRHRMLPVGTPEEVGLMRQQQQLQQRQTSPQRRASTLASAAKAPP